LIDVLIYSAAQLQECLINLLTYLWCGVYHSRVSSCVGCKSSVLLWTSWLNICMVWCFVLPRLTFVLADCRSIDDMSVQYYMLM